jgi:hypothetical protein
LGEEMKELKEQFAVPLNKAALMDLRRWTQCSSDRKRKLSNGELMQTHEEFGFATGEPEKHCCKKEALVLDWIQTFYCEAIIKLKAVSMRFKNISASDVLLKNEINNEHNPPLLYINPSFTDRVQIVLRRGIFLKNSRRYRLKTLPIFLSVHCSPTDTQ